MRKFFAAMTAAVMSFSLSLASPTIVSDAAVPQMIAEQDNNVGESGVCGTNVNWELSGGKLTIKGSGKMVSWLSSDKVPWKKYKSKITSVEIERGVTSIGSYAFMGCTNINSIKIADTVTNVEMSTFNSCTSLGSIEFPASVSIIGRDSMKNCSSLRSVTIYNPKCEIIGYTETICNSSNNGKGSFSGTIFGTGG